MSISTRAIGLRLKLEGNRRRSVAVPVAGLLLFLAAFCYGAVETTLDRLAKLSAALSDGNGSAAISAFDSSLKQYGEISQNIDALTAQTDIVCAIDVIGELDKDGVHQLDTDWVLQLRSKGEHGGLERRRERIQLEMRLVKGKWKITSISNEDIFATLRVR